MDKIQHGLSFLGLNHIFNRNYTAYGIAQANVVTIRFYAHVLLLKMDLFIHVLGPIVSI